MLRLLKLALFTITIVFSTLKGQAQDFEFTQNKIEAVYIYNFIKFTNWPHTSENFVIAVVGKDGLTDHLKELSQNKTANGRPIEVKELEPGKFDAAVDLVFVENVNTRNIEELMKQYRDNQTMIFTHDPEGLQKGSCVNFQESGNRVKFEINFACLTQMNIQIASKLKSFATNFNEDA